SPRILVPKVEFVSAPGTSPDNVYRPGGPYALVTSKAVFAFDREKRRFRLLSLHPDQDLEGLIEATGFAFDRDASPAATSLPPPPIRSMITDRIAPLVAETYPQFAERLLQEIAH
ncbi:MAG: CoA synthetase, partial [Geminicoccaceae bacterium]